MQTIPQVRAELIRLQAELNQVTTELKGIPMGTREFGKGAARVQQLMLEQQTNQKRLTSLLKGGQPSLF